MMYFVQLLNISVYCQKLNGRGRFNIFILLHNFYFETIDFKQLGIRSIFCILYRNELSLVAKLLLMCHIHIDVIFEARNFEKIKYKKCKFYLLPFSPHYTPLKE